MTQAQRSINPMITESENNVVPQGIDVRDFDVVADVSLLSDSLDRATLACRRLRAKASLGGFNGRGRREADDADEVRSNAAGNGSGSRRSNV
jgi:hypothetical protein